MDSLVRDESRLRRLLRARRSEIAKLTITTTHCIVNGSHGSSAPHTQYNFQLRSSDATTTEWTIKKRYSECYAFHLKLSRDSTWNSTCFQQHELIAPFVKMQQKASGPKFPRKHARYDTTTIIQERRRGLTNFVLSLLAAYTDLDVLLTSCENLSVNLGAMFADLQQFLEKPRERKEMELRLTQFFLVLKDVEIAHCEEVCCICLSHTHPSNDTPLLQLLRVRRSEIAKVTITVTTTIISNNDDTSAPHTQYIFALKSSDGPLEWTMRKRYSQCYEFYLRLSQEIQWEWTCLAHQNAFEPLVRMLEHAAVPNFLLKPARYDTEANIHERVQKLADFVRTLLAAYTDLEVLLGQEGHLLVITNSLSMDLHALLFDLKQFLDIPSMWKAIMAYSTQDVQASEGQSGGSPRTFDDTSWNVPVGDTTMVQLPCGHPFHDDCIIQWLRSQATCPICRRAIKYSS